MERKKITALLFSMLALCLCTILIVGGTYALFTDSVTVNHHLEAGNLKIGLWRTNYAEYTIDDAKGGLMSLKEYPDDDINLLENSSKVFTAVNAVPTSYYWAEFEVSNLGSTAFNYGVRILWEPGENPADNVWYLVRQLRLTVNGDNLDAPVVFMLDKSAGLNIDLGDLLTNEDPEKFTVQVEFVCDSQFTDENGNLVDEELLNNLAMLANVDIDVQVYATQKTH